MSTGILFPVEFFQAHKIPKVHCTLIYLGDGKFSDYRLGLLEEAAQRLGHAMRGPNVVRVKGLAVYGSGTHTVMTLDDYVLKSYRHFIEKELARSGMRSASQYAYNPHITINKHSVSSEPILPWDGFQVPPEVMIDRPQVWSD
jgi:2'-5' RNA ligase